jgi:hypothetical protein
VGSGDRLGDKPDALISKSLTHRGPKNPEGPAESGLSVFVCSSSGSSREAKAGNLGQLGEIGVRSKKGGPTVQRLGRDKGIRSGERNTLGGRCVDDVRCFQVIAAGGNHNGEAFSHPSERVLVL